MRATSRTPRWVLARETLVAIIAGFLVVGLAVSLFLVLSGPPDSVGLPTHPKAHLKTPAPRTIHVPIPAHTRVIVVRPKAIVVVTRSSSSRPKSPVAPKPTPSPTARPTPRPTPRPTAQPTHQPSPKPTCQIGLGNLCVLR